MSTRAQNVIDWCRALATLTEEPGYTTRTFLSPQTHEVHRRLGEWMRGFGMEVTVDAAGKRETPGPSATSGCARSRWSMNRDA